MNLQKPSSRIYVGSIQFEVTSDQVKAVFEAFGKVTNCQLLMNPETGKHRGYGFIDFEEEKSAIDAVDTMNGFELCGRPIKVGFAHNAVGNDGALLASQQGKESKDITTLSREENLQIDSSKRYEVMQKLSRPVVQDSSCIVLRNMVDINDVDAELEGEVKEEAAKFGTLVKIVIHRNKLTKKVDIFLLYQNVPVASKARESFDKRWFGGRVISAEFYPVVKFTSGMYS